MKGPFQTLRPLRRWEVGRIVVAGEVDTGEGGGLGGRGGGGAGSFGGRGGRARSGGDQSDRHVRILVEMERVRAGARLPAASRSPELNPSSCYCYSPPPNSLEQPPRPQYTSYAISSPPKYYLNPLPRAYPMSRPSTVHNLHPPSTTHTHPTLFSHTCSPSSKNLTLWIHDPDSINSISKHEAVLNYELFPPGVAKPGDVAEVRLVGTAPNGAAGSEAGGCGDEMVAEPKFVRRGSYAGSVTDTGEGGGEARETRGGEEEGRFFFVIRKLEDGQRKLGVQVSWGLR